MPGATEEFHSHYGEEPQPSAKKYGHDKEARVPRAKLFLRFPIKLFSLPCALIITSVFGIVLFMERKILHIGVETPHSLAERNRLIDQGQQPGNPLQAVAVLGFLVHEDGWPSPALQNRLIMAKQVAVEVAAKEPQWPIHVIFSGGICNSCPTETFPTEASIMRRWWTSGAYDDSEWGAAAANLIDENKSVSTYTNAIEVLKIAQERGISSIGICTNGFHQLRSLLAFNSAASKLGWKGSLYVVKALESDEISSMSPPFRAWFAAREFAALIYYLVTGKASPFSPASA